MFKNSESKVLMMALRLAIQYTEENIEIDPIKNVEDPRIDALREMKKVYDRITTESTITN